MPPVMSVGSRSGVNWMRWYLAWMDRARALVSVVLPTPGTSSNRTCPLLNRATSTYSITWSLPRMTKLRLSFSADATTFTATIPWLASLKGA